MCEILNVISPGIVILGLNKLLPKHQ